MKRIVLSGYYGFGNAGDEAVLAGLIQGLRVHAGPEQLEIAALSINPGETAATHGIAAAHRYKNLLGPLARCGLLASGGGSLLQDVTSAHGIFYYLGVVRLAQMLGKKTMFVAQGIGPLTRPRSRKLTAFVANRLDAITVRDPASAALLREIGVTRPIAVTADPALLLVPTPARPVDGNDVGIALRPWRDQTDQLVETLADAYRASMPGISCHPLDMHDDTDASVSQAFLRSVASTSRPASDSRHAAAAQPGSGGYRNLLNAAAGCRMVIGMRLHALIFAAACSAPSVALAYDPKVNAFMEQTGQADAVYDIRAQNAEALAAILGRVWSEREARGAALTARLPELRAAAQKNADAAWSLME